MKPGPGYGPKYTGTVWSLMFLDQMGGDPRDRRVRRACRYVLEHTQAPNGGFGWSNRDGGVVHCLNGNIPRALIDFGLLDDPSVRASVDWQARSITGERFDGYYRWATAGPGFRCAINAGDVAAASMLRARGLQPIHHFWHMQIELIEPSEPDRSPDGIDIGGIEPDGDLPAIHALLDEAFADDRSHHPAPLDRWIEEETNSPSYDPMLWLLARDAGVPVGVLTASVGEDRGWVDYLAVLESHRGRGIGAALLDRSFAMFMGRDIRRVLVSVDAQNPTGATGVYERVGMRIVNRWDQWERPPASSH